jgi:hypothetical protein
MLIHGIKQVVFDKVGVLRTNEVFKKNYNYFVRLDQSFKTMFTNYTKRASIDSYGGTHWSYGRGLLRGYEEVVTDGIPTFYVIDLGTERVVKFDSNWNYQDAYSLYAPGSYNIKYVNGYFYVSAENYFYKMNTDFFFFDYVYAEIAGFRQFDYDYINSVFYVAAYAGSRIYVYTKYPRYITEINFSYRPHGVNIYNGSLYVVFYDSNKIAYFPLSDRSNINYLTGVCSVTVSLFIDPISGDMVTSCESNSRLNLLSSESYIQTSFSPFIVSVDSYKRMIVITTSSIDIYY